MATTAKLRGWVHDDAGAAVSGATVALYNDSTGLATGDSTTTDSSGEFDFTGLDDTKVYDIKITSGSQVRWAMGGAQLQMDILRVASELYVPASSSAAPTNEGGLAWDSDDDLLKVGTGSATKTLVDTDSTQTLSNKTLSSPTISGTIDLSGGTLVVPTATSPAQTTEGSIVWDSDSDLLTVGDGSSRKTLVDTGSTQTLTSKTFTTPKVDSLHDTSQDLAVLDIEAVASAVNRLKVVNNIATGAPALAAVGSDDNIDINLQPKGTGILKSWNGSAFVDVSMDGHTHTSPFLSAYKTTDTARSHATSLTDDPDLKIDIESGADYAIDGMLLVNGSTTGDFKVAISLPSSASKMRFNFYSQGTGASASVAEVEQAAQSSSQSAGLIGTSTTLVMALHGVIINSLAAQTLAVQWCQVADSATGATLEAGSWIRLTKLS